jgi:hypothetical protein
MRIQKSKGKLNQNEGAVVFLVYPNKLVAQLASNQQLGRLLLGVQLKLQNMNFVLAALIG